MWPLSALNVPIVRAKVICETAARQALAQLQKRSNLCVESRFAPFWRSDRRQSFYFDKLCLTDHQVLAQECKPAVPINANLR
jgi:hypothetical protein